MKNKRSKFDNNWRKTATALYIKPIDGRIMGTYEADVTESLKYIEEQKLKGNNISMTHLITGAIAQTFSQDVPAMNTYTKFGRMYDRDYVSVFVSIEIRETRELAGFLIKDTDKKSVTDIAKEIKARIEKQVEKAKNSKNGSKNLLVRIPWPFRRILFLLIKFFTLTLGLTLKILPSNPHSFGSVSFSNIASSGVQFGFGALLPIASISTIIVTGKITKKPVVINNKIEIRDILPIGGTFDHRLIDGQMCGRFATSVEKYLMHPHTLESLDFTDAKYKDY